MIDDSDHIDSEHVWHVWQALDSLQTRGTADMTRLATEQLPGMRGSIAKLMELIPADGCRKSELAHEARVTKQAVGQRLADMIALGIICVSDDPTDRRAQIVSLTEHGRCVRAATRAFVAEMESEWAAEVGVDDYATFRSVLDRLAGRRPINPEPT